MAAAELAMELVAAELVMAAAELAMAAVELAMAAVELAMAVAELAMAAAELAMVVVELQLAMDNLVLFLQIGVKTIIALHQVKNPVVQKLVLLVINAVEIYAHVQVIKVVKTISV